MSRSAEEQLLLDQRIQAMKRKNEELRRRHMEVEADKLSAAKQNALVSVNVRHDDDWCPGRHDENPRPDRHHQNRDSSPPANHDQYDQRNQRSDHHRSRHEGYRDESNSYNRYNEDSSPKSRSDQNYQNPPGKRRDFENSRQKSERDRFYGNENRRSTDRSGRAYDGSSSQVGKWNQSYSSQKSNSSAGDANFSRGDSSGQTFTSKVYKNSSFGADREKRPTYRLAEGDGPPPDPSYSFLGDSMRDSPESSDKRRGFVNRRGFSRPRGRGGQSWNNRSFNDSGKDGFEDRGGSHSRSSEDPKQQSYDAWRRERSLIDQERINRQKTSDGSWSREWDNNKVFQEGDDRPQRWRRGNQTSSENQGRFTRGYEDNTGNSVKYNKRRDGVQNTPGHENEQKPDYTPRGTKHVRRGRFSSFTKEQDFSGERNGSVLQQPSPSQPELPKQSIDTALLESKVKTGELLQVSLVSDGTGEQTKRCVEGTGRSLMISVSNDTKSPEGKSLEQKYHHKKARKGKRSRVLSTTSTGTTGTAEEDDGSWEDLSSDEENVSVITELQKAPHRDVCSSKSVDVSSGPESLDPIPAPGKEDEFLWDDFHPAGFQDNVTLAMDAEAAYKALLDEKAKQEVILSDSHVDKVEQHDEMEQPPQVSFKLDHSSDEKEDAKLDPLLVTTQIVQAEVDCMSLTSLPTDVSLPYEISQFSGSKVEKDDKLSTDEEGRQCSDVALKSTVISAEELSGPVSILDVKPAESESFQSKDDNLLLEKSCIDVVSNSGKDFDQTKASTISEVDHKDISVDVKRHSTEINVSEVDLSSQNTDSNLSAINASAETPGENSHDSMSASDPPCQNAHGLSDEKLVSDSSVDEKSTSAVEEPVSKSDNNGVKPEESLE